MTAIHARQLPESARGRGGEAPAILPGKQYGVQNSGLTFGCNGGRNATPCQTKCVVLVLGELAARVQRFVLGLQGQIDMPAIGLRVGSYGIIRERRWQLLHPPRLLAVYNLAYAHS